MKQIISITVLSAGMLFISGCGTNRPQPHPDLPNIGGPSADRPGLSPIQCTEQGGSVVPDIGDGRVHRADFMCPVSGKPPMGTIQYPPGGPIAIEGSVCCGG